MENLKAILTAAGLDFSHVVKTCIFITDMNQFSIINGIYGKYFQTENYPGRMYR
jgi:2-iminobutanoate/2-iminopropanoate deaminase